jgi:hypothetical protein
MGEDTAARWRDSRSRLLGAISAFAMVLVLAGSAAQARCPKDCKQVLQQDATGCRQPCAKGEAGRVCRAACRRALKTDLARCRRATNPTAPDCGATTTTITTTTITITTTTLPVPCSASQPPTCGGTCPAAGLVCLSGFNFCACVESDNTCGLSEAPTCGGTCPNGDVCTWVHRHTDFDLCGCVPPDQTCGFSEAPTCGGTCPGGTVCGPLSGQSVCGCDAPDSCGFSEAPTCGGTCPLGICAPNGNGCRCELGCLFCGWGW